MIICLYFFSFASQMVVSSTIVVISIVFLSLLMEMKDRELRNIQQR